MAISHLELAKAMLSPLKLSKEDMNSVLRSIDKLDKLPVKKVVEEITAKLTDCDQQLITNVLQNFLYQGPLDDVVIADSWGPRAHKAVSELQELWKCFLDDVILAIKLMDCS